MQSHTRPEDKSQAKPACRVLLDFEGNPNGIPGITIIEAHSYEIEQAVIIRLAQIFKSEENSTKFAA
ncbi:MAG: hypothetical protein ACREQW_06425 [Candidatus Binatia bacterium]